MSGSDKTQSCVNMKLKSGMTGAVIWIAATVPAFATIDNTVTVMGTAPGGTPGAVQATADESVDVEDAAPGVQVNKSSDVATVSAAGDQIQYSVEVSNSGNVTLSTISVSDNLITLTCPTSGDATIASLAPGSTEICTATFTTTQPDFDLRGANDGGSADEDIDNQVDVSGQDPQGGTVQASATHSVALTINPQLSILKTADLDDVNNDGFAGVGETITYNFDVTNNGNVTLTNIQVGDLTNATNGPVVPGSEDIHNDVAPTSDSSDAPVKDGIWDVLAPGDTIRFTAQYIVTQQDVDLLQ